VETRWREAQQWMPSTIREDVWCIEVGKDIHDTEDQSAHISMRAIMDGA